MLLNFIGPIYLVILTITLFNTLRQLTHFTKYSQSLKAIKENKITTQLTLNLFVILLGFFLPTPEGINLKSYAQIMIPIINANIVLSIAFYAIRQKCPAKFLPFFYHLGQLCILFMSWGLTGFLEHGGNFFSTREFMAINVYLILAVLFGSAIVAAMALISSGKNTTLPFFISKKGDQKKHLRPKLLHHYQQAGLTQEEIATFRQEMAEAQKHIYQIEDQIQKTAKMRAIEVHYNLLKVSKNYFKDIVAQPQRFLNASHFILTLLPQLDDLLTKYNEINAHVAKNKHTYLILEKSAQTIDQICQEIINDYLHFHEDKYHELEDGIKLADRSLKHIHALDPDSWSDPDPFSPLENQQVAQNDQADDVNDPLDFADRFKESSN